MDARKDMAAITKQIAKDSGEGNQNGPKPGAASNVNRPQHMKPAPGTPGIPDTVPAARARQAEQDRNRFDPPTLPKK
jgi:hypothetical protein